MAVLLDWRNAGPSVGVMQPAVEALLHGGVAVLPSEAGYLFAASAWNADAVGQLTRLAGGAAALARLVSTPESVEEAAGPMLPEVKRILARVWPGPMGVVVSLVGGGIGRFRCPAHSVIDTLATAVSFPLLIAEPAHRPDVEESAISLADQENESIAVIVDAGPIAAKPLTWVAVDAAGWRVEQPGCVSAAEIVAAAARWIVFVCTGNTCRSPMAEWLFKTRLAQSLGCRIEELSGRGYRVFSAGMAAYPGDAPSPEAVSVIRELGADLSEHRSEPLAMETAAHADWLIGMTRAHLLALLSRYPVIGGSLRLLCGAEGDLDDPIGCGPEVYEACARTILRHVDRLITELECK